MQTITKTERLKLVEVTDRDVEQIFQLTSNEEVMRYFPKVLSHEETQKILHQYSKYGYCFWKVLLKPEDIFVGIAGLLHQEIDNMIETEISYRILEKHWRKGYATEAAKACKQYAEVKFGKKRLISLIHPQNVASIRVATKLGAERTNSVIFLGEEHDVYVYTNQ